MALEEILDQPSIVMVGDFNPAIFHPEWLISNGFIEDFNFKFLNSEQLSITGDLTVLELPDNVRLQVQRKRFAVTASNSASLVRIIDLAKGVLTKLPESPVTQIGLNVLAEYRGFDSKQWVDVGNKICPHDFWKGVVGASNWSDQRDGLLAMRVRLPWPGEEHGMTNLKVGISPRFPVKDRVLEMEANNHCEVKDALAAFEHIARNENFYSVSKTLFNEFFLRAIGITI